MKDIIYQKQFKEKNEKENASFGENIFLFSEFQTKDHNIAIISEVSFSLFYNIQRPKKNIYSIASHVHSRI